MDALPVLAALLSALLHASWNAAVKAHRQPALAMAAQMAAAALLSLPLLAWAGLPAPAAWPWLAASTAMNMAAVAALLRAYAAGGFGMTYAMVRATSVLGVVPLAAMVAGEWLAPPALGGAALIVASLAALGAGARGHADFSRRAWGWTLAAGACSAAYVVIDAQGARRAGSAIAYGAAVSIANALAMAWLHRRLGPPWRWLAAAGHRVWLLALASTASYLLILWAYTRAPIAAAAALRDTSALFAMLIGVLWLKERLSATRLLALALAAAGVPLLRLG
jgi:drug/metabolite transporter (DMT)-like permease